MEFNWKKELKRLVINLADELYFIGCSIFVSAVIFHFQPEKSIQVFNWIRDFKDFSISLIFLTGIGVWAMILRLILTKFFYFIIHIIGINKIK